MKKTTIGIVAITLRILFFVSIAMYVYYCFKLDEFNLLIDGGEIELKEYNMLRDSIRFYQFSLFIFVIISGFFNLKNKKNRIDRKISLREYLLPEFNYSDERESSLTGKAAKAGLAILISYTALLLLSYVFYIDIVKTMPSFVIFTTVSIPIVGLLAYYISYRYYYSK